MSADVPRSPARVLVVWEDFYFQTLGPFVKKRLAARAAAAGGRNPGASHLPAEQPRFPELLFHTSHGNGGFQRYVSSTWENVRAKGLPGNPGPIDHLLCVVDGDKLHERIPGISRAPALDLPTWLTSAEHTWEEHLRALCKSAPRSSVHGRLLCWSKESLVLAGYDRSAFQQVLGIDLRSDPVDAHLARCVPVPSGVPNGSFSSTFRHPLRCLTELDSAHRAPRPPALSKNAPELDDVLRALVRDDCALIAERVPDIDRLADSIWSLATNPASATPAPSVPAPSVPARTTGKKKRG